MSIPETPKLRSMLHITLKRVEKMQLRIHNLSVQLTQYRPKAERLSMHSDKARFAPQVAMLDNLVAVTEARLEDTYTAYARMTFEDKRRKMVNVVGKLTVDLTALANFGDES